MVIKKIIKVENLGCLRRLSWGKGVGEIGELVGLFAENGAGKTTLVAALRAAREEVDDPLMERRSLPRQGNPNVEILTTAGVVSYNAGIWNGSLPSVEVFDRSFIEANVYDGRKVGPDQRAHLYRLALGSGEVEAAVAVDDAKQKWNEADKPRGEIERRLRTRCGEIGITLDELRNADPLAEPPPDLEATQARLRALETRQDLTDLPGIFPLPPVPGLNGDGLQRLLDQTAASLSKEATAAVRDHIATHLDANGEAWLRQGVEYAQRSEDCPFCGQSLSASAFSDLFPRFFDDSYQLLQERIARGMERLKAWDDWVSSLRRIERSNQKAMTAWSALLALDSPPEISDIPDRAEALVKLLRSLMNDKQARLLDPFGSDPRVQEMLKDHRELLKPIAHYNTWANGASEECRKLLADYQGEVRRLQAALRGTQGRILRGSTSVVEDLAALEKATTTCAGLLANQKTAEENLKKREGERTATFLEQINEVLKDFGAGFRLRNLEGKSSSKRVIADFQIALVDGDVEREGARVRASAGRKLEPRFDTMLSEGDRTTLALAVFFARCIDTPDPSRIAVLDDPLTSLDRSRRTMTSHHVNKLGESCAQVWLLSHDEFFLKDALPRNATFLSIEHGPSACTLEKWDVQAACRTRYARNIERLEAFVESTSGAPTADDAWQKVRPVLEEYLRFRFRHAWQPGDWLLNFIQKGRVGDPNIPLAAEEIEHVATWCRFSNPGMHGDPSRSSPTPSASELRGIVRNVLEFVHG